MSLKKKVCMALILNLIFFLFTGCKIQEGLENTSLNILKSQYETGLIKMNTDIASGEMGMPMQHRIFSDILKMNQLNEYALVSEISDCHVEDLVYDACYIKQIEYNKEIYNVFAYVFLNTRDSMQYYENYTTYPALNFECQYEWLLNPTPCFIAYDNRVVLRIEGRSVEMIALLLEDFASVFDVEFKTMREMMDEALYSGQLSEAMREYAIKLGVIS